MCWQQYVCYIYDSVFTKWMKPGRPDANKTHLQPRWGGIKCKELRSIPQAQKTGDNQSSFSLPKTSTVLVTGGSAQNGKVPSLCEPAMRRCGTRMRIQSRQTGFYIFSQIVLSDMSDDQFRKLPLISFCMQKVAFDILFDIVHQTTQQYSGSWGTDIACVFAQHAERPTEARLGSWPRGNRLSQRCRHRERHHDSCNAQRQAHHQFTLLTCMRPFTSKCRMTKVVQPQTAQAWELRAAYFTQAAVLLQTLQKNDTAQFISAVSNLRWA